MLDDRKCVIDIDKPEVRFKRRVTQPPKQPQEQHDGKKEAHEEASDTQLEPETFMDADIQVFRNALDIIKKSGRGNDFIKYIYTTYTL